MCALLLPWTKLLSFVGLLLATGAALLLAVTGTELYNWIRRFEARNLFDALTKLAAKHEALRDADGVEDERRGIILVFDGPSPEVKSLVTIAAEAETVRDMVATWLGEGIVAQEIGLFVRGRQSRG